MTDPSNDISCSDRTGGAVEIDFNKLTSDGVNIYSKRDGDVDFIFLARDTCLRREGRGYGREAAHTLHGHASAQSGRQTRNPGIQSHVRGGRPGNWYLQPRTGGNKLRAVTIPRFWANM